MSQPTVLMQMPFAEFVARSRSQHDQLSMYHIVDGGVHYGYDFADKAAAIAYHEGLAGFASLVEVSDTYGFLVRTSDDAYVAGVAAGAAAANPIDVPPDIPDPLSEEFNSPDGAIPAGWVAFNAPTNPRVESHRLKFTADGLNGGGAAYRGVRRPIGSIAADIIGRTVLWKLTADIQAGVAQVGVGAGGLGSNSWDGPLILWNTNGYYIEVASYVGGTFSGGVGGRYIAAKTCYLKTAWAGTVGALNLTCDLSHDGVVWQNLCTALAIGDPGHLLAWACGSNGASGADCSLDFMRYVI